MNIRPAADAARPAPEAGTQPAGTPSARWLELHAGRTWYQIRVDVCGNPIFKLADRAILLHACTRFEDNRDGGLFKTSLGRLARAAGVAPRTARTVMRRLERMGAVEVVTVGGGRS